MREPKCAYFGRCGGCDTQHLEYSMQLRNKVKNVSNWLKVDDSLIKVFMADDYGYRNRMDFIVSKKGIGLREKGGRNDIVDIDLCPISNSRLNELLTEVRDFFVEDIGKAIRYAVIRTPSLSSTVSFVMVEDSNFREESRKEIERFAKKSTANNIVIAYVPYDSVESISSSFEVVKGSEFLKEKFLDKEFFYHSQGFFQNNSLLAPSMISYVSDLLAGKKGELLDLYGGVGVFGLSIAKSFSKVTIVENSPFSIECAKMNITENNISNAEAVVLDAKNINKLKFSSPLHVITDPPRTGMENKAISNLISLNPETIIYISCYPEKFKNEMVRFVKNGYVVKSVAFFDMFPQTNHIEIVVEMVRG